MPELKQVNDSMAENLDDGRLFTEIGRQFHDLIVRGCGNHTIIAVVGSLETLWSSHERQWADESAARGTYPSLAQRRAVLNTHTKLTETIAEGDVDQARHRGPAPRRHPDLCALRSARPTDLCAFAAGVVAPAGCPALLRPFR